jgi:hypothetical protein
MSTSLPTLDPNDLDTVTGGKQKGAGYGSSGSSGTSDVLSTLTGLNGQIKDLAKAPAQSSAFGGTNLMLFAMLAMNRPAPTQTNVVYVRRRGCW